MALHIERRFVQYKRDKGFDHNPDFLHFYVNVEISKTRIKSFYRPLRSTSDAYLVEVGEKGAELVKRVMAIPGVSKIFIEPYELCIHKTPLFNWEDIVPRIEKAIREIFGGERGERSIGYLSIAEIPLAVILKEPFKRLGWTVRKTF